MTNSDYGQPPYCFDTCHFTDGSFQHHSVSSSSLFEQSRSKQKTTPKCFEIEFIPTISISINESIFNDTSNASLSSSAISIISLTWSSIIVNFVTFIVVLSITNLT